MTGSATFLTTSSSRDVLYIVSSSLFIYGLMGMTGPKTAVRGNRLAAGGWRWRSSPR